MKTKGCGILPYSIHNGEIFLLCGIDYKGKISDLGGKINKNENPIDCAVREFYEETVGIIETRKKLKKKIKQKTTKIVKLQGGCYNSYIIELKYESFVSKMYKFIYTYVNKYNFIKYDDGYFEMTDIKWIPFFKLKNINKNKLSSRFYSILKQLNNIDDFFLK